ncbi:MAG: hypothetical protein QXU99_02295 [Candidatus Bathyarchaeia archaeon]
MSKKTAKAFAPAGISSFFEICDTTANGKPITDLKHVGARGGGFALQKGVLTEVSVSESETTNIRVFINGKLASEAETTTTALQLLLNKVATAYTIDVYHKIEVPIGAGFGTSAGGALTAVLALAKALRLPLTFNEIGEIAHAAEVKCKTGLGTVGPLMTGGCVLTIEPGAPGVSKIDHIPLTAEYAVVVGFIGAIPTKQVLNSVEKKKEVNRYGKKTLDAILTEPTLENFLAHCWDFAEKTGFATARTRQLVHLAKKSAAIGAAQNMVGEAIHAVAYEEKAQQVVEAFKQLLPEKNIIMAKIDQQGARLL